MAFIYWCSALIGSLSVFNTGGCVAASTQNLTALFTVVELRLEYSFESPAIQTKGGIHPLCSENPYILYMST